MTLGLRLVKRLPVLVLAASATFCGAFASSNNEAPLPAPANEAGADAGPPTTDAGPPTDEVRDAGAIPDAGVDARPPPPCGTHKLAWSDDFSTLGPGWVDEGYPSDPPTGTAVLDVGRLRLTRSSGYGILHRRTSTFSLAGVTWLEVRMSVTLEGAFASDSLMFFQLSADGAGADSVVRMAVQGGSVFLQDGTKTGLAAFARPSGTTPIRLAVTFLPNRRRFDVTVGATTASAESVVLPPDGMLRMFLAAFSDLPAVTSTASVLFDDVVVCTAPP